MMCAQPEEPWRREAARRFPDLSEVIAEAEGPTSLWIELNFEFEKAYDSEHSERIAAIYAYARWCCEQPPGQTASDDLGTIVCTCFYEHIPAHPKAVLDMPKWWTREDVVLMKQIFSYFIGDDGYAKLLKQFDSSTAN